MIYGNKVKFFEAESWSLAPLLITINKQHSQLMTSSCFKSLIKRGRSGIPFMTEKNLVSPPFALLALPILPYWPFRGAINKKKIKVIKVPLNVHKMTLKRAPVDKIKSWRVKSGLIFAIGCLVCELRPRRRLHLALSYISSGQTEHCGKISPGEKSACKISPLSGRNHTWHGKIILGLILQPHNLAKNCHLRPLISQARRA